jgi:hypothetical protein
LLSRRFTFQGGRKVLVRHEGVALRLDGTGALLAVHCRRFVSLSNPFLEMMVAITAVVSFPIPIEVKLLVSFFVHYVLIHMPVLLCR